MKKQATERIFKDPVCGMSVSRLSAVAESQHNGKPYYFCALACKTAFDSNPESYLKPHRQHGVRPD